MRCRRCGGWGKTVYDGLCGRCLRVLIAMGEAADKESADVVDNNRLNCPALP